VVHYVEACGDRDAQEGQVRRFQEGVAILDSIYPKIKVSLLIIDAHDESAGPASDPHPFGEHVIAFVSEQLQVPLNMMFIACPGKVTLDRLCGVRIITN